MKLTNRKLQSYGDVICLIGIILLVTGALTSLYMELMIVGGLLLIIGGILYGISHYYRLKEIREIIITNQRPKILPTPINSFRFIQDQEKIIPQKTNAPPKIEPAPISSFRLLRDQEENIRAKIPEDKLKHGCKLEFIKWIGTDGLEYKCGDKKVLIYHIPSNSLHVDNGEMIEIGDYKFRVQIV
jgi:hypothetical protein